jgi:dTDP-4-dehydrorhamnose 3,5-epimerase
MKVKSLELQGVYLIEHNVYEDERGLFFETFNGPLLSEYGIPLQFLQDNQSVSHKGVLRGLHFQNPPFEQGKLVRVVSGSVIDIVVDIRKNSPSYGQHLKIKLDEYTKTSLWVPPGFAHGFAALEDNTIFMYKVTNVYNKESESGIIWNDSELNIDWEVSNPIVSTRDQALDKFANLSSLFRL